MSEIKEPATENASANIPEPVKSSDKKTQQTVPTLYPDIEFINRTLP